MLIHILLSLTLVLNLAVTSQKTAGDKNASKPDFTGIWNARILRSVSGSVRALKISYSDPKLEIVRMLTPRRAEMVMGQLLNARSSNHSVYYTDGRGETQKSVPGDSINSKTERSGDKFVITLKESRRNVDAGLTTTMEVSADGKMLTETLTFLSEGKTRRRIVHLYDRHAGDNTRDINGEWVERRSDRIISLSIEHREPEIKITRREISEAQDESEVAVYYTDGRGETNIKHGRTMKSVTKWKDQTLVFALSSKSEPGEDKFEYKETIKWQFAKDGLSLVEVSEWRRSDSKGFVIPPDPIKLVYARSSKPLPDNYRPW